MSAKMTTGPAVHARPGLFKKDANTQWERQPISRNSVPAFTSVQTLAFFEVNILKR